MPHVDDCGLIERLILDMTLVEKLGQLTMVSGDLIQTGPTGAPVTTEAIRAGQIGSVLDLWGAERVREVQRHAAEESRLGIPLFFGLDVLYGLHTIFPVPLGEACSFDPELWEQTARVAAQECSVEGIDLNFAPMIDVSRDPRWGRAVESPGEDTLLAMRLARAKVFGFQTANLAGKGAIAATAKHFSAYGAVQGGREYAAVDISARKLHEVYLPPFHAAVEAGVAAIMPAFIDLNGMPMSANSNMLRDLVHRQWGFSGVIISDYGAVAELIKHGIAGDLAEAAALALNAGIDIDMMGGGAYFDGLPLAVERGLVSLENIDRAVRRVLKFKQKLGLFTDPYRRCPPPSAVMPSVLQDRRDLAWKAACRSIVLLSNKEHVLPIDSQPRKIAVIGPLADAEGEANQAVAFAARGENTNAVLEGLRNALPRASIAFAPGSKVDQIEANEKAAACDLAHQSDIVVLCLGETRAMSGEAASRGRPGIPTAQLELAEAICSQNTPIVLLLFSGRPLILEDWLVSSVHALVAVWFPGSEAAKAIGDILSGCVNPTGRLSMSWPADVGQIPVYFSDRPTGRPASDTDRYTSKYLDIPNNPRFPFGYGLSYSQCKLCDLQVDRYDIAAGGAIEIAVDVINEGRFDTEEIIFFFIRDLVCSVTRPSIELKDFQRVRIPAGACVTARFRLTENELCFLDRNLVPTLEAGAFDLYVGPSAALESLLSVRIHLTV